MLLLAFTAAAIGFPIWYRWPYTEKYTEYVMVGGQPDKSKPDYTTQMRWRRTWGGGRVLHGQYLFERHDGESRRIDHYENGVRNGPHRYYVNGELTHSGQYAAGLKTGEWVHTSDFGEVRINWKDGRRHGATEDRKPGHPTLALKFDEGLLTEVNGSAVPASWRREVARIQLESPQLAESLAQDSALGGMSKRPLKEAVQALCDVHDVPPEFVRIDFVKVAPNPPNSRTMIGIDLLSSFAVLAQLHGLGCDYRYGCLWITSAEDARDWTDPTGVLEIQPKEGTSLAEIWSQPVSVSTMRTTTDNQPLATILKSLATQVGLEIDTSQINPTDEEPNRYSTVFHINQHPFHLTLGILLYETGCRCELHGDKLVILPPEHTSDPRE
jgi:hypothetical protein